MTTTPQSPPPGRTPGRITARALKWDYGPSKEVSMLRLGEDEHGVWLGAPPGEVVRTPVTRYSHDYPFLWMFPRGTWWTAMFNPRLGRLFVYVDICTPAEWDADGNVTIRDLDLDVYRPHGSTTAHLDDEDEFAEHRVTYGYPPEVVETARRTAAEMMAAVTPGPTLRAPFGGEHLHWFDVLEEMTARQQA